VNKTAVSDPQFPKCISLHAYSRITSKLSAVRAQAKTSYSLFNKLE